MDLEVGDRVRRGWPPHDPVDCVWVMCDQCRPRRRLVLGPNQRDAVWRSESGIKVRWNDYRWECCGPLDEGLWHGFGVNDIAGLGEWTTCG